MLVLLALSINMSAQSLAERTGENTSFYNAVCILNDIEPGNIGMNEGRKLMQEYAVSIGLDYKLYEFNGRNNLYILHYVAINFDEDADISEKQYTFKVVVDIPVIVEPTVRELIELNALQVIEADMIDVDYTVDSIVIAKVQVGFTCDCRDMDVAELNQYYTELLKLRRTAIGLRKDKLDACSYQLRKYKKVVEQSTRKTKNQIEDDYSFNELLPNMNMGDIRTTASAPAPTNVKCRKLGNGHARGKGDGFWTKLFPYINC